MGLAWWWWISGLIGVTVDAAFLWWMRLTRRSDARVEFHVGQWAALLGEPPEVGPDVPIAYSEGYLYGMEMLRTGRADHHGVSDPPARDSPAASGNGMGDTGDMVQG